MASADFLASSKANLDHQLPQVIASSFRRSLLDLLLRLSLNYLSVLDLTMMCLLIQANSLLSSSCSLVPTFVVSLPSDVISRLPPLRLTNGSKRYLRP